LHSLNMGGVRPRRAEMCDSLYRNGMHAFLTATIHADIVAE